MDNEYLIEILAELKKLNSNVKELLSIEDRPTTQQHVKPFNFKEASQYLGISDWKLRELKAQKKIKYLQPSGRGGKVLFTKEALDQYIQAEQSTSQTNASGSYNSNWMHRVK